MDLISREALINDIKMIETDHPFDDKEDIIEQVLATIDWQRTIEVPQWIPCSERFPEEKGWYHCTCKDNEVWNPNGIVCDLYWYPSLEEFVDNRRYEMNGLKEIEKFFWTKYVVAWIPLPEPYKGE